MPNTREKLVELLNEAEEYSTDVCCFNSTCEDCPGRKYGNKCRDCLKADHLIANGIIVPPLKVDQKVYTIPRSAIREWTVAGVWISADPKCSYAHIYWEKDGHHMGSCAVNFSDIERTLFLSREEAEAALHRHRKENENDST